MVGGDQVEVGAGWMDAVSRRDAVHQHFVEGATRADAERQGQVALRIDVDKQHARALERQTGADVDDRGGLADAAL